MSCWVLFLLMSHTIIRNKKGKIVFEYRRPELLKVRIISMTKLYLFYASLKVVQLKRVS